MAIKPRQYAHALSQLCAKKSHAQIDAYVREFLALLTRRGESRTCGAVLEYLRALAVKREGGSRISVVSARDLESDNRHAIEDELRNAFGQASSVSFATDERLLDGLKIKVGDTVYDATLSTRLSLLKKHLLSH